MCPISILLAKFFYVITSYPLCPEMSAPTTCLICEEHVVGPKCGKRRRSGSELNCPTPPRSANSQDMPLLPMNTSFAWGLWLRGCLKNWLVTMKVEVCAANSSVQNNLNDESHVSRPSEYILSICCTSSYFWGPHIFCSHKLLRVGNTPSIMPKSSVESPGSAGK